MKGLVLELRDGLAAVLLEDGQVVTTAMACQVGETVELPDVPLDAEEKKTGRRWVKVLAAAVLALAVAGGGYAYTTALPCSYLSVDTGGASVELAFNRRGQVIDVRAMDADSVILAQELLGDLDRMPVEEALDWTMVTLEQRGFLADGQSPVILGVTADSEKREAALEEAAEKTARENRAPVPIYTVDVPPAEREEAARQQLSGGRYVYEKQEPVRPDSPAQTEDRPEVQPQQETVPPEPEEAPPTGGEQADGPAPAEAQAGTRPQDNAAPRPGTSQRPQQGTGGGQAAAPQENTDPGSQPQGGEAKETNQTGPVPQTPDAASQTPDGAPQDGGPEQAPAQPEQTGGGDQSGGGGNQGPGGGEPAGQPQNGDGGQPGGEPSQGGGAPAAPAQPDQGGGGPGPGEGPG